MKTLSENDGQLLQRMGIDASIWAQEFMRRFGECREDIDEGLMIAWFANAIEAGRGAYLTNQRRVDSVPDEVRIREAMYAAKANPGRVVNVEDVR